MSKFIFNIPKDKMFINNVQADVDNDNSFTFT